MIQRLLREPLVHFLALGAMMFVAYAWINKPAPDEGDTSKRIVIDQQELDHLIGLWKLQWKREPDVSEIQAIIDRYLRREVFYREALRMNLDHNDQIIKKRLAQKMEAVAIDLSNLMQPRSDEQLREYFHRREDLFRLPQAFALRQVLFLPEEMDAGSVQVVLSALRGGADIPDDRRQKLAVSNHWPVTPVNALDQAFGGDFARALEKMPVGEWSGPIRSGYGWHLVFIETRQAPTLPPFEQVKEYVVRQFDYQAGIEAQDRVFRELLGDYQVEITAENIPENIKVTFADP